MERTVESPRDTYLVEGEVGRGGMGITSLVKSQATGRQGVLKELRLDRLESWKGLELFERECQVLQRLDHPAIPAYLDHFRREGSYYLVQEYVEGQTFRSLMEGQTALPPERFEELLRQGLHVLAYLHGLDPPVIHRDITPNNLIVQGQQAFPRLFLVDFGSVREARSSGLTAVGTFGYMAPEQASGEAGPPSDIYGLGLSLLALASHREAGLLLDQETGRLSLEGLGNISERARRLIWAMVRVKGEDRLASARRGLDYLEGRLPLEELPPQPAPRRRTVVEFLRGHVLLALGLLIFLLLTLAWLTTLPRSPREIRTLGGWFTGHSRLISAMTGTILGDNRLLGRPNTVEDLAFSPDGAFLASLGKLDDIILWEVAGGETVETHNRDRHHKHLTALAFGAEGQTLLLGHKDKAYLYTLAGWQPHHTLEVAGYAFKDGVCPAPDRCLALFAQEGGPTLRVYGLPSKGLLRSFKGKGPQLYHGALSPKGDMVAAAGGRNLDTEGESQSQVEVWGLNGSRRGEFAVEDTVERLSFSPDGRYIAADGYQSVSLASLATRQVEDTFPQANLSAFAPSSDRLALVENGTSVLDKPLIKVVDLSTGRDIVALRGHMRRVKAMAFSPDGALLATGSKDQTIKLWRLSP